MADLFTLASSSLPDDVRLLSFKVLEAMSSPFEIVVHFHVNTGDDVDLTDAIGAKAHLMSNRADGVLMEWRGVFAAMDHVHQSDEGAIFRALIVPAAWFLALGEHSRIFVQKNLKEFVSEVMEGAGLRSNQIEWKLNADPPVEEHVCQYHESDLAFIHRWFEREGIYYYFDQTEDGAKMVITDQTPSDSLRTSAVPYFPTAEMDATSGDTITRFRATRQASLASIALKDYDYMKPQLDVVGKAEASKVGHAEYARFAERFLTSGDGDRIAKFRAEAVLAREETYIATGTAVQLRVGYVFELERHPRGALNKKYLATKLEHTGIQVSVLTPEVTAALGITAAEAAAMGTYKVEITATDAELPYRAAHTTRWPRISGQEVAIVDGEADGDYAQLDDAGRYLVKFPFDENAPAAGKGSTRIRMMQPHAGAPEGFHFPLRKGTEVVVMFLGGDPDRPVIMGAIPNMLTPSPVTSKNHTHNMVITGGLNHIDMEDKDGSQYVNTYSPTKKTEIHMGAPKDWKDIGKGQSTVKANMGQHTDGIGAFSFGADWRINVGAELEEHVVSNVIEDYDAQVDQTYQGPKNQTVTKKVTETFNAGQETNVTGLHNLQITGTRTDHVTKAVEMSYDTTVKETIGGTFTQTITGASDCTWSTSATHKGPILNLDFKATDIKGTATLKLTSAKTTEDLGIWGLKAGITTWNTAAFTWTAPSVTINAPTYKVDGPSSWTTGVNAQTVYQFTFALATCAIAVSAINIGVVTSLNVAMKNLYLENKGFSLGNATARAEFNGLLAFS